MALFPGARLGPYEITAKLGEGGMGEVYRATDTKLKRDVAIKVLPAAFTEDKERLARFEREAQLLAQLHHPNIASIFGLEESDGIRALVMELVDGPTLAERLEAGSLSLHECLSVAVQIAQALEEAHDKGIVHRDLKPQNIKASLEGKVKVLDFGLAKAMDPAAGSASAADLARSPTLLQSPTLTAVQGTQLGVILGTAAYMAPEQARGGAVDKRADIWAFGVVLYEMLVGRSLFAGETVTDTLAGVLKTEIDFAKLPEATPSAIRTLLRRCLERNPRDRLHDIGDARLALEDFFAGRADSAPVPAGGVALPTPPRHRERVAWALAALGLLIGVAALWIAARRPSAPPAVTTRFTMLPSQTGKIDGYPALSPDGRRLAYVLLEPGSAGALWIHDFDSGEARRLSGTDGALDPFWSPDGRSLAFFARGELRKVASEGGVPQSICAAPDARGGSWGQGGDILFTPNSASGLFRVSAAGGAPTELLTVDSKQGEQSLRFPWFLPDGRHFLVTSIGNSTKAGVYWASLDGREKKRILPDRSLAAFDPRGYLLFVRETTLMAQRFDPERGELSGEATPVAERVGADPQKTAKFWFALSANGVLAVRTGGATSNQLLWFDRAGQRVGILASKGGFSEPALSPDETRIVVQSAPEQNFLGDLWIYDVTGTDRASRLTFGPASNETPIWSPDGTRIAYTSPRAKGYTLFAKAANGSGPEEELHALGASGWADDWSRDGRYIVFERYGGGAGADLWLLPMSGERKANPYLETPANEAHAAFSPDGRYLAYVSDESGVAQIYVQTVPLSGSKWQVSTAGGDAPSWRADGKELYFIDLERKLTAVPIRSLVPFALESPQPLFTLDIPSISPTGNRTFYAAMRDGKRFLVNSLLGEASEAGIRVTLQWAPPAEAR
jgi:Tol biopolymer transport system component